MMLEARGERMLIVSTICYRFLYQFGIPKVIQQSYVWWMPLQVPYNPDDKVILDSIW